MLKHDGTATAAGSTTELCNAMERVGGACPLCVIETVMVVVVDVERREGELYFGVWNVWRGVVSTSAERMLKFSCQTSGPCPTRFCGGVCLLVLARQIQGAAAG